jgi:TetR/AcrR family transcriptional regulator
MQSAAVLPAELDYTMIQLAILALATYPVAFGQMTRLVTGYAPTDPRFQKEWYEFLRCVGEQLLTVKKTGTQRGI